MMIFVLLTQVVFSIKAIIYPQPESNQVIVNICYSLLSFFQLIGIAFSYSSDTDKNSNIIYGLWVTMTFRISVRMLDFEDTAPKYTDVDWYSLAANLLTGSSLMFVMLITFFKPFGFRKVVNFITWLYLQIVSVMFYRAVKTEIIISIILSINLYFLLIYVMGMNFFKIIANMDLTIIDNNKFKQIIENQNEAVIIISGDTKIDYVNNKFLKEFKDEILEIYDSKYINC